MPAQHQSRSNIAIDDDLIKALLSDRITDIGR